MKALTITAQPKAEAAWVHRFRNFGEEVYVSLRASCEVNIAEIDAAFDEFHVSGIREEEAFAAARIVATLNREHHLDDSVFVSVCDAPVYHQTVGIVLDAQMGERVWELTGRHPIWIVGSEVNRAAVESLWTRDDPNEAKVTIWSNEFEVVTADDWLEVLSTVDLHHGGFTDNPPMYKLTVYGAVVTPPAVAALRDYGFEVVLPTASGFIALQKWDDYSTRFSARS